ncbi:MAG TPA: zinc-dependent peptidase [Phycisphaeraceae bacterium]|nr:zinc-dependent peptidase [Phycisphaeraceae bacterium]
MISGNRCLRGVESSALYAETEMILFKQKRRARLREKPLPDDWREYIEKSWPYYRLLQDDEQKRLLGHVHVLMHEKKFEGCAGLEINDEIRLSILMQAALLILNNPGGYFRILRSILVYPQDYLAPVTTRQPDGSVSERTDHRLGESWEHGLLVLSWRDVKNDISSITDGHNVVLHEFAHQLDSEDGRTDGLPVLADTRALKQWQKIMMHEYRSLQEKVRRHEPDVINPYGATNPAEFFAVATETFFEHPLDLLTMRPVLYEQLQQFYKQDTAARFRSALGDSGYIMNL